MAEMNMNSNSRKILIRHRGRGAQVWIYLGKMLRMFVYQSDWKVLPMSALIAGLVGMVIRKRFFINMEGTLMSAFAMVCVCIWNGCFNSIQVICRERDVVKREHRSGMHISSYVFSHMLYQALLCLAQVGVTLYITRQVGVKYPAQGLITPFFLVDFAISMFLITFASDMMSLWISTLARTTTTAMTIMPFVLIFQLVFSGGMLTLPEWTKPLTRLTISNPGLKVIATQADTNKRPYATIATMVSKMRNSELGGSVSVGQILDLLQDESNPAMKELRAKELGGVMTVGELRERLEQSATFESLKQEKILEDVTVDDLIEIILESEGLEDVRNFDFGLPGITLGKILSDVAKNEAARSFMETKISHLTTVGDVWNAIIAQGILDQCADMEIGGTITIGELVDMIASNGDVQARRDQVITVKTTLGKVLDLVGEENVKSFLEEKAAEASYTKDYEYTMDNVVEYWFGLFGFIMLFAILSTITLEFIDKDKR
ncbi:MAG: ABC transporter permease [Clostridia bacterium]|nr:ABC transporter permease [Clostridia bacterium]